LIVDSPRRPPLESRVLSHGHHHGDSHANHRQQQPTCAAEPEFLEPLELHVGSALFTLKKKKRVPMIVKNACFLLNG
jgi:hypothetical protein